MLAQVALADGLLESPAVLHVDLVVTVGLGVVVDVVPAHFKPPSSRRCARTACRVPISLAETWLRAAWRMASQVPGTTGAGMPRRRRRWGQFCCSGTAETPRPPVLTLLPIRCVVPQSVGKGATISLPSQGAGTSWPRVPAKRSMPT